MMSDADADAEPDAHLRVHLHHIEYHHRRGHEHEHVAMCHDSEEMMSVPPSMRRKIFPRDQSLLQIRKSKLSQPQYTLRQSLGLIHNRRKVSNSLAKYHASLGPDKSLTIVLIIEHSRTSHNHVAM